MPYIQEICRSGKVIEITKYFSTRIFKKGIERDVNFQETSETQKKINENIATRKLRRIINANFGSGDLHITLTYSLDKRPTEVESKKIIKNFVERLRAAYKKEGKELKYILVTEYKNKAIHHHMIVNEIDTKIIMDKWAKNGRVKFTYLDNSGDYTKLAEYLIKETKKTFKDDDAVCNKRWTSSRNLIKPKISKKIVKRNTWKKEPIAKKGYYIDKSTIYNGISEFTQIEYQFYKMIKLE